jgi:hypothetical protein
MEAQVQQSTPQPPSQQPISQLQQPAQKKFKLPLQYISFAILVIIISIGAYLSLSYFKTPATYTTNSTVKQSTTISSSTNSPATTSILSNAGAGSGNYYLSQAQTASIIGSGGSYSENSPNSTQILMFPKSYKITDEYDLWYNNTSSQAGAIHELVFLTQNLTGVYDVLVPLVSSYFNQTYLNKRTAVNDTSNGMTYTSMSYAYSSPSAQTYNTLLLVGMKNNEVVYLQIASAYPLNASVVVSAVAQDLP